MKFDKIGYVEISTRLVKDFWGSVSGFIPLKIVDEAHKDCVRYLCYHEEFRKLEESDTIPTYTLTFKTTGTFTRLVEIDEVKK